MSHQLANLHAPLDPILRELIARAGWRRGGLVLDVGCGAGLKHDLVRKALGPHGWVMGIDIDRAALRKAREQHPDATSAWIAGDAVALPVRSRSVDSVACVAVLGSLPDQTAALREVTRVLAPGGSALLVTGAHCWSAVHPWPPEVVTALAKAYLHALDVGELPPPTELCEPLAVVLHSVGLNDMVTRAFLLDAASAEPLEAELALAQWTTWRRYLAPHLPAPLLAHADACAAAPEDAQLVPVVLATVGFKR